MECHDWSDFGLEPAKAAWMGELCTNNLFLMFVVLFIDILYLHVISGLALAVFACLVTVLRVKFGMNLRTTRTIVSDTFDSNKKTKIE